MISVAEPRPGGLDLAFDQAPRGERDLNLQALAAAGLDERTVMEAIGRARRRFFLRPRFLARHVGEIARLVFTSQALVWKVVTRMLIGERVRPVTGD